MIMLIISVICVLGGAQPFVWSWFRERDVLKEAEEVNKKSIEDQ